MSPTQRPKSHAGRTRPRLPLSHSRGRLSPPRCLRPLRPGKTSCRAGGKHFMVVCHLFSALVDKQSITIPDKQREHGREELVWAILKPGTAFTANDFAPLREFCSWPSPSGCCCTIKYCVAALFHQFPLTLLAFGAFFVSQNIWNM